MFLKIIFVAITFLVSTAIAYEIPDENEELARTCRIAVKIKVLPDEQMKKRTGRAIVSATLTDDADNPYRQERIDFTANAGTFTCQNPEDTTTPPSEMTDSCFTTGFDGVAKVYLVNIPVNTPIRVTASYMCSDRKIASFATMSISRGIVKKKKRASSVR
jgi:hypothetical protein